MGNQLSAGEIDVALNIAAESGDHDKVVLWLDKGGNPNRMIRISQERKSNNTFHILPSSGKDLANNNNIKSDIKETDLKENFDHKKEINNKDKNETAQMNVTNDSVSFDDTTIASEDVFDATLSSRNSMKREKIRMSEMNAFHRASKIKNNLKVLKVLLPHVKNIGEQDSNGDTALHHCVRLYNNRKMVLGILGLKPNVNAQNDDGETPLHCAVLQGCDYRTIEALMVAGCDPNVGDNKGDTALHICARRRGIDPMVPGMLLRFGGNPNLKNIKGQTTLHVAATSGNKTVLLLLKFNAKVRLRDNEGRLPSDVAATDEVKTILLAEEEELFTRVSQSSGIGPSWITPSPHPSRASSLASYRQDSGTSTNYKEDIVPVEAVPQYTSTPTHSLQPIKNERILVSSDKQANFRASRHNFDRINGSIERQLLDSGGDGVIFLPDNKEEVIPPDAIPVGTSVKVTIDPCDDTAPPLDFNKFNFDIDIKLKLPGGILMIPYSTSSVTSSTTPHDPPAFTGLCMEGDTTWRSERELTCLPDGKVALGFKIRKEKAKRAKRESILSSIEVDLKREADDGKKDDHESPNHSDGEDSCSSLSTISGKQDEKMKNCDMCDQDNQAREERGVLRRDSLEDYIDEIALEEGRMNGMDAMTSDEEDDDAERSRKRSKESIDYHEIDTSSIMLARQVMVVSTDFSDDDEEDDNDGKEKDNDDSKDEYSKMQDLMSPDEMNPKEDLSHEDELFDNKDQNENSQIIQNHLETLHDKDVIGEINPENTNPKQVECTEDRSEEDNEQIQHRDLDLEHHNQHQYNFNESVEVNYSNIQEDVDENDKDLEDSITQDHRLEKNEEQMITQNGENESLEFIHDVQKPESVNDRIQHPIDLELATIPEESHGKSPVKIPEFYHHLDDELNLYQENYLQNNEKIIHEVSLDPAKYGNNYNESNNKNKVPLQNDFIIP